MTKIILTAMLALTLTGCPPEPVTPDPWQGDAGACQTHWVAACLNAVSNGLGAAYPQGCTATAAEEHCK